MKALMIAEPEAMIMALHDEIRRNDTSRYDHRLHGVLLVAQGMTSPQVAELLGDSPRTVVNWVRRFDAEGLAGLSEGDRSGRPRRLDDAQLAKLETALRGSPAAVGLPTQMWDGPTLSAYLRRDLGVKLGNLPDQAAELAHQREPAPLLAAGHHGKQLRPGISGRQVFQPQQAAKYWCRPE